MSGKRKSTKSGLIAIIAVMLAAVLLVTYIGISLSKDSWNPAKWVTQEEIDQETPETPNETDETADGEMTIETVDTPLTSNAPKISLMTTSLSASANDGIATVASTTSNYGTYTLTATVYDENGDVWDDMQSVEFTYAWKTTKTAAVGNYVSMSVDGMSATFTCLQPFDTQIVVTCTSTLKTTVTATATLDYRKKIESATVDWKGTTYTITDGSVINVELESAWIFGGADSFVAKGLTITAANFGTGSVSDTIQVVALEIAPTSAFTTALSAAGNPANYMAASAGSFSANSSTVGTLYSEYSILSGIYDGNSSTSNFVVSGSAVRSQFLSAIASTTNQFNASLVISTANGGTTTINFVLNCSSTATTVSSITMGSGVIW